MVEDTGAPGAGVASVVWSNAANGTTGTASGVDETASVVWFTPEIPLVPGDNDVTITANDRAGRTASYLIKVTRLLPSEIVSSVTIEGTTLATEILGTYPIFELSRSLLRSPLSGRH